MLTGVAALRAVVATLMCLTFSSAHKVSLLPSPLIGTLGDIVHALCCNEDTSSFMTKLSLRRNNSIKKAEPFKCSYFENTGCTNCSIPAVQENNGSLLVCSVLSRTTGEVVSEVNRTFHVRMAVSEEDMLEEASLYGLSWRYKLAVAITIICLSWFAVFFVLLWQQHIKYHEELQSATDHQHNHRNQLRENGSRTNGRAPSSQTNGVEHHMRHRPAASSNNANGVS